jgi:hypothetical protein
MEIDVEPRLGDRVLLLFLQYYDPAMFSRDTVYNHNATGYNYFSGVGILMSDIKHFAKTILTFSEIDGEPHVDFDTEASVSAQFYNGVAVRFCNALAEGNVKKAVLLLFEGNRPFITQFLSRVIREHGFAKDDKGNPVDLDAAITEKYSVYAPITKDIQGKQTIKIGIGEDEDTQAPVDIEMGEKADITINSGSSFTSKFKKAMDVLFEGAIRLVSKKAITLKSDSAELVEIGNQVATLKGILDEYNDILQGFSTVGSATAQAANPATIAQLVALKIKQGQVLK